MKGLLLIFATVLLLHGETPKWVELNNQAVKLTGQARYKDAEPLYRDALSLATAAGAGETPDAILTRGNLGALLVMQGRYSEAKPLLEKAIEETRAAIPDPVVLGRSLRSLATLYHLAGDLPRAEAVADEATTLFHNHPEVPASEIQAHDLVVAAIYVEARRFQEAEDMLRDIPDHATPLPAITALNLLAACKLPTGDYAAAESYSRRAVALAKQYLPNGHPGIAAALNNLAQASRFQEQYLDAERYYREAIDQWTVSMGPAHPNVARGYMNLAAFYHERGRESGAEDLYARAVAIFENALGPKHPQTLIARNELAEVLRAEHRFTESDRLSKTTLTAMQRAFEPGDTRLVRAQANRERLLQEMPKATASLTRVIR